MKSRCIYFTFVLFFLCYTSNPALSQWQKVFKFPTAARTIYFLDQLGHPEIGFAGLNDGSIWRTMDAGTTWQKEFTDPNGLSISDITFKDNFTGWFCTDPYLNQNGVGSVYKTIDGGLTWQVILQDPSGLYSAIYYFKPQNTLYLSNWLRGELSSNDEGNTWNVISNHGDLNGYAFADAQNGLVTTASFGFGDIISTNDGGANWQLFYNVNPGWQPAVKAGTASFFIFSEYSSTLTRRDVFGFPWQTISTIIPGSHTAFTGCLRISSCTGQFFVQSDSSQGFYMSNDEGVTWQSIGGPINEVDSRFGLDGPDVLASDLNGGLWVDRGIKDSITVSPQLTFLNSKKIAGVLPGKDTNINFSFQYDIPSSIELDSFAFDISFNSNMLNLDSAGVTSGWKIKITKTKVGSYHCMLYNPLNQNIAANQSIAFFYFSTFLTIDTSSEIVIENSIPFFNPLTNIGCTFISQPLLNSSNDSVQIQTKDTCGDATLRNFLQTGKINFSIISIRPNPAQDELNIETESAVPTEASVIILDNRGREWYNELQKLSGRNNLSILIPSLPSGNYHLMLKSASGSITSEFVKVH